MGLQQEDIGVQWVEDGITTGAKYPAYETYFRWDCGLAVPDWRYVVRGVNVDIGELTDEELVLRVRAGEPALYELLMRRHNQRLYRAIRAVLRDDREVEDVMQQAYLNAFLHLDQFKGTARFSTWLTRRRQG